jgi:hypothetical protein
MKRSQSTVIKNAVTGIDSRIKNTFNRDFFSIYEGIIEKIDIENGFLNVRIPALDNTLYEECRIMTSCCTDKAAILPLFEISAHVMVGFQQFSLAYPVVLGQITPAMTVNTPYEAGTLILRNGHCAIKITDEGITMFNETSSINIADSVISIVNQASSIVVNNTGITINCPGQVNITSTNIAFEGDTITANGEDLTDDDVGVI